MPVRMPVPTHEPISIEEVLRQGTLEMHFQPITSIRRSSVLGVEALVRARDGRGNAVSPLRLFEQAGQQQCLRELDEHCLALALKAFAPLHQVAPEFMLFVNLDAVSLIPADSCPLLFLQTQCRAQGIDPRNITVEILESRISDVEKLRSAVARYREAGFSVVLDDIGAGDSNLDRIAQVQPDMIKADRSLIQGISEDYMKQEIFKALVQMSERIGGWVITEGIETREDALTVLNLGGDLLQGYYLGRPEKLPEGAEQARSALRDSAAGVRQIGIDFRRFAIDKNLRDRQAREDRLMAARCVREALKRTDSAGSDLESAVRQIMDEFTVIESVCVLDTQGLQNTDVFLAPGKSERQRSVVYAPPGKGSDHSLKEYFYLLEDAPLSEYETNPYVPLPNTDLCVTITLRYPAPDSERIACVHTRVARGVLERDSAPKLVATEGDDMPRRHDGV